MQRRSDETLRENARNEQLLKDAFEGRTKRVEHLTSLGVDSDFVSHTGLTALHWAACGGYEDTVQVLLLHFGDVNAYSPTYGTPI